MVKQSWTSARSMSAAVMLASLKALATASLPASSSCMLGRTFSGRRSAEWPMPAISTARALLVTLAVWVMTRAAAPSVTREQSCRRRGAAIIMFLHLPLASSSLSSMMASTDAGPFWTWARGFSAPFL